MSWLDLSRIKNELFRLKQNETIRLAISSSLRAVNAQLYLETDEITLDRTLLHREWTPSPPIWTSHFDAFYEFAPRRNGSYKFELRDSSQTVLLEGYLSSKPTDESFDSARIVTLMPKFMGPFATWDGLLERVCENGYNFVHFTPLQQIGHSASPYSIADQLSLEAADYPEMERFLDSWRDRAGFVTDVVWNHTANDSAWLKHHPEATYNLINTPHLLPAFLLDYEIGQISAELSDPAHPFHLITSEEDLKQFGAVLTNRLLNLKLEEYRQCNVKDQLSTFSTLLKQIKVDDETVTMEYPHLVLNPSHQENVKFNRSLNLQDEVSRVTPAINSGALSLHAATVNLEKTLLWLNKIEREKMEEIIDSAVNGVKGTMRYERIDPTGPKLGPVSSTSPICPKYFSCPFTGPDAAAIVALEENRKFIYAHNGWVMDWNPVHNFVDQKFEVYLKRQLCAWDDSAKLRYGDGPQSCPALWERMEQYTKW